MKKVKITYNPYLLKTVIEVEGRIPKSNSKLNFGTLRIQEWASKLPKILEEEYNDRNFTIEFTGTEADYNELISSLNAEKQITANLSLIKKASVLETESKVKEIFREIQEGRVPQLKDDSIVRAFNQALNQEFEINVIATMSSGKSTLINALLDKKLMPVANTATTATIVRIIDSDQDNFSAIAYDSKGKILKQDDNIVYRTMREWNSDSNISKIDIFGRIPCVDSVGMKLVLVDTPGPNNSEDANHRTLTYRMLDDSDKSLVLFVLNGRQLNVDDQKILMDHVSECMSKGGKQSRERYIFVFNQMDAYNPEDEDPRDALEKGRKVLDGYEIKHPNIFPVSALAALECRTNPKIQQALPNFTEFVQEYEEMHFDSYYDYNNLPTSVRHKLEKLKSEYPDNVVEIHTGIVSIEEAIGLYIDKYARALKVRDLVDSFNNRLNEIKAISKIQSEIRKNQEKKQELERKINDIENRIDKGHAAQELSKIIDKKDFSAEAITEINEFIGDVRKRINKIIESYSNQKKVKRSSAESKAKELDKIFKDIIAQLDSKISAILEKSYRLLYQDIFNSYIGYLSELGIQTNSSDLGLRPLDFVAEELANLTTIMNNNCRKIDEGTDEIKTEKIQGKKKTNWFFTPWNWFTERYEYKTKTEKVHIPDYQEYIDMHNVASQFLQPLQVQAIEAEKAAREHCRAEASRIKMILKKDLSDIDNILKKKLGELKQSTNAAKETQEQIRKQEEDLQWMESIILRVNELVKF